MKKFLLVIAVLCSVALPASAGGKKTRTTICETFPGFPFPVEFTKEWYEHKCKIIYAEHGGYAPGAHEPRRKARVPKHTFIWREAESGLTKRSKKLPPCGIRECE
jgi:hypothetical protein